MNTKPEQVAPKWWQLWYWNTEWNEWYFRYKWVRDFYDNHIKAKSWEK